MLLDGNREFRVLSQMLTLASLVTDKSKIPRAKPIVEFQRNSMVDKMSWNAQFIEKILHRTPDKEIARLFLEARDLFRLSVEFPNKAVIQPFN